MGSFIIPPITPITGTIRRQVFEYSAGKVIYSGEEFQSAAVAATTWVVKKYFYSGSDLIDVQVITGAWTNRAALAWKSAGGD